MKVRTSTLVVDYKGGTSEGIELAFDALHNKPKTRAALLEKLTAAHVRMQGREAAAKLAADAAAQEQGS